MAFKGQNFNGSNGKDKSSRLSPASNISYSNSKCRFPPSSYFFTIQCWLSNVQHLKKARSPNIATSSSMLASANAFAVPANTTSLHSVASSRVVTVFGYYLVASGEDRISKISVSGIENFFFMLNQLEFSLAITDYIANIIYVGEHRTSTNIGGFQWSRFR